ncbi:trypsin-1-like [Cloeon dipterum]|uniref:trypsin-1-like n=1 Tax=Cloeon dipterum TaxID=197152 RepID=UPI00321F74B9
MLSTVVAVLCCVVIVTGGPSDFKRSNERIVGGTEVAKNEIPWQVSIQFNNNNDHWCGGSIISEEFIVTTARCSTYDLRDMHVVAGTLEWAKPGSVHNVTEIINSPEWTLGPDSDISLWRVNPPFTFDASTNIVRLPAQGAQSTPGTVMTVSGWGITTWSGQRSDFLLKADVPIVSKSECNASYAIYGGIGAYQICAGLEQGGVDACLYDTGGPLFLDGLLHGIYSWGYHADCAVPGFPGVYTEVSVFRDWIGQITGI